LYCSEADYIQNASLKKIERMISNLSGVKRIIVTGGEPLVRNDAFEILRYIRRAQFENVSLATNGVLIDRHVAENLSSLVDYVDVTIDGPRRTHNEIRGEYDAVVSGIKALSNARVAFSLVTVLFKKNVDSILYVCQIADTLGAVQLKIVTPIYKGRGMKINSERLSSDQLSMAFHKIRSEKERNGWMTRVTMTDWNNVGEGHAILVHPDGYTVASPVPSKKNGILGLGNVLEENIKSIWTKYPYKENHLRKYLEKTLYVC
jgi:MoaA/NifB/PqqE/SkfB family radical SAM enzyme